jgi:hypothetical protein
MKAIFDFVANTELTQNSPYPEKKNFYSTAGDCRRFHSHCLRIRIMSHTRHNPEAAVVVSERLTTVNGCQYGF